MVFYQLAVAALRLLSPLLGLVDSKLARGIAGRRHAHERLATWGRTLRDPERPVVWLHAPSVGEGLQALAVKDALAELRPDLQVVFTHFSPSAESLADDFGADVTAYLPWDLRGPVSRALDGVRPDLLAFTKTEVWPVLTAEAARRDIPVAMVGGTVPEGAGRMALPARMLMRRSWRSLDLACAISDADAGRLAELGVAADRIRVTGDPGIDSAAARFDHAPPDAPYLAPLRTDPRPTVVAGSTWPADEAVLLPALGTVRAEVPVLRVVVAPHEPTEDHVTELTERLAGHGWSVATLGRIEATGSLGGHDAVVVDRVGVLAHLYGVATVSFVGGGFHDDGLHSVLEPAAAASPMVFGPGHRNARAAGDLLEVGAAAVATDSEDLARVLLGWLREVERRTKSGEAARGYIQRHRGAARRTAQHLLESLSRKHESS